MKSVGTAALQIVEEVSRQLHENPEIYEEQKNLILEPLFPFQLRHHQQKRFLLNYLQKIDSISIQVIVNPIAIGLLFGSYAVGGLLPGALVSEYKWLFKYSILEKYIEAGFYRNDEGEFKKKGQDENKEALIGDTVGGPLKDISEPPLNFLIKLMTTLSLVLARAFCRAERLYKG